MFLDCMSLLGVVDLSLQQACSNVSLEDVAVLGDCCPPGRDSFVNLVVLVFVYGAISLTQVDVAFNVLDMSVVDIYWCVVLHHHLCLRHIHHLIPVAFVVFHVVY